MEQKQSTPRPSESHHLANRVYPRTPSTPRTRARRSSLWKRLRKRLHRRGVLEIDIDHHMFKTLEFVRVGIRKLFLDHGRDLGPKEELDDRDYDHVWTHVHYTNRGRKVTFCSYASSVFAAIRSAVGVTEKEYLNTVAPPDDPYLEFISNSKSGQDFFLSHDQQYILKTEKPYYINIFLSFLGEYLDHFQMFPHSLIVKFLGLYSIQLAGEKKIYLLPMQNILYPPQRIETRFDLKGCLGGRYQKPHSDASILTTYKDKNFLDEKITLGVQKDWFLKQLRIDVDFLRDLGVQDYSLLIGRHERHAQEEDRSFRDIVMRVRRTFSHPMKFASINEILGSESDIEPDHHKRKTLPNPALVLGSLNPRPDPLTLDIDTVKARRAVKKRKFKNLLQRCKEADSFHLCNLRLLPNCRNPLHVIDTSTHRYYLGIIDFFTLYECKQRVARFLKSVKYLTPNHSTVPPFKYGERFLKFIEARTE